MTKPFKQFNISPHVGRIDEQQKLLDFMTAKEVEFPFMLVIAEGGMGKSHLIEDAVNKVTSSNQLNHNLPEHRDNIVIIPLDIQWSRLHTVLGLMHNIFKELKRSLPQDSRYFEAYETVLISYSQIARDQSQESRISEAKEQVQETFLNMMGRIAEDKQVIILIDTLEEFERLEESYKPLENSLNNILISTSLEDTERDELWQAIDEERDEFILTDVREFLKNQLFAIPNIRYVLAGRNREVTPSVVPYYWYTSRRSQILPRFNDTTPEEQHNVIILSGMTDDEAAQLLKRQGYDLEDPSQANRDEIRRQIDYLKAWGDKTANKGIGNKPIFILMLAEIAKRDSNFKAEADQATFERTLVKRYWEYTIENTILLRMAIGQKAYIFDAELIRYHLNTVDHNLALDTLNRLKANPLVREHQDGISVQDEFKRLLRDHVLKPRNQLNSKEERQILKINLQYFMDQHTQVEKDIFEVIGDLQYSADPNYNVGQKRLNEHTRKTIDQNIRWAELDQRELALVNDMSILTRAIGYYDDIEYVNDLMRVFANYWKSFRAQSSQIKHRRYLQIIYMGHALHQFFWRSVLDKEPNNFSQNAYWDDLNDYIDADGQLISKTANHDKPIKSYENLNEFVYAAIELRRRHIQHAYHYANNYREAVNAYQQILDSFEESLLNHRANVGAAEKRHRAEIHIEILLKLAVTQIYDNPQQWGQIDENLQKAFDVSEDVQPALTELQSEILRQQGWSARLQWKIWDAIYKYDAALDKLNQGDVKTRSLSERYNDFATALNNLAYAYRYIDAHSALIMAQTAYNTHERVRRQMYLIRTARPLAVIHRLLGNHEQALKYVGIAYRYSDILEIPRERYLSKIQELQTIYYAMQATSQDNRSSERYLSEKVEQEFVETFLKFYKKEEQETEDGVIAANNSFFLGDLIQFYYLYIDFRYPNNPKAALEIANHCRSLITEYLTDDAYRTLLAHRARLAINEKDPQYPILREQDAYSTYVESLDYRRSHELVEDLQNVALVVMAQIIQNASNIALQEGLKRHQSRLFANAINHTIDSYFLYASQTGYNVVMLYKFFQNLTTSFDILRGRKLVDVSLETLAIDIQDDTYDKTVEERIGSTYTIKRYEWDAEGLDTRYIEVLNDWCHRFEAALLYPEQHIPDVIKSIQEQQQSDADTVSPRHYLRFHDRQYEQAKHFVLSQRILNTFLNPNKQYMQEDIQAPALFNTEEYHDIARVLMGEKTDADPEYEITKLLLSLLDNVPNEEQFAQLREVYSHYTGETLDLKQAFDLKQPDNWLLGQVVWDMYVVVLFRCRAKDFALSYDELIQFTSVVENLHYVRPVGTYAKLYLAWEYRECGYSNATERLLYQALQECDNEHRLFIVIRLLNESSRLLALMGDYLSATFYSNALDRLNSVYDEKMQVFTHQLTKSRIARATGGLAAKRGSPQTVDGLYNGAIEILEQMEASDLDAAQRREIAYEKLITYGYWLEDADTERFDTAYGSIPTPVSTNDWHNKEARDGQPLLGDRFTELYRTLYNERLMNTKLAMCFAHLHIRSRFWLDEFELGNYPEGTPKSYRTRAQEELGYIISESGGANNENLHQYIHALALRLELRYIGSRLRPNLDIPPTMYDRYAPQIFYREHFQNDEDYLKLQDLQSSIIQDPAKHPDLVAPTLLNIIYHPKQLPEAFRHDYAWVELIAGWVAQRSELFDEALNHYIHGGLLMSESLYSVFHIGGLVKFMGERIQDLYEFEVVDHVKIHKQWLTKLLSTWGDSEAFNTYYADVIEFLRTQKMMADLRDQ